MNYKTLFSRSLLLLSSPAKAWKEIIQDGGGESSESVGASYVYPMITLCGLSMFIGVLFGNGVDDFNLQVVLTKCLGVFVSLFGGYFLSIYLIEIFGRRFLESVNEGRNLVAALVGYSMVVIFVLDIFTYLFPSFFIFKWILQFYLVYIVWEGVKVLMSIPENKILVYTIVSSMIILLSPFLIEWVFGKLSSTN